MHARMQNLIHSHHLLQQCNGPYRGSNVIYLHAIASSWCGIFRPQLITHQRGLLEAFQADIVLVEQLVLVVICLVMVRCHHHLFPQLPIVWTVR